MGYLKKYVGKYYRLFLTAVFFLSVEAFCDLLQPLIMSRIVDVGIRNSDLDFVLRTGLLMLAVTAVGATGAVVRNNLSCRVAQRFGSDLRLDLYKKIESLPYDGVGRFDPASLVTRLTNDVMQIQNFVLGTMRIFVKSPLLCLGSIVMAVILEPKLSVLIAVILPFVALIIYLNNRIGYPFFRKVQRNIDRMNGVMREFLSGVRVVKAFSRAQYEKDRFARSNGELYRVQKTAMRVTSVFSPVMMLVMNSGIVLVLWIGGFLVNVGSVEVGKIIAFVNYMTQMSTSLMMISTVFTMFVRARASGERIGEVMNVPEEKKPSSPAAMPAQGDGIVLRGVCFSYSDSPEKAVLQDLNLTIGMGSTFAIIGSTGAGKSTLVNLIPRFYTPTAGKILFNGTDIRQADEHALRERIAVVPQKNTLFSGTILENLRWGDRTATLSQIEEAARIAQIHDFIAALPEGYDTVLGQGGVNLSGGQKQRLAIARALLKKPSVLILDDCTSAVDLITERRIRDGLIKYSGNLCCIVIAQRIASVMEADSILVLDGGRVCGLGTHDGLLKSCGIYREIYASQFSKEGLPDAE